MHVSDFDYELPEQLIAQVPVQPRDSARLMVYDRRRRESRHQHFRDLCGFLQPDDLLVVNDTRVLPHRLRGRRPSGGRVDCLILDRDGLDCVGYVKPARKIRLGESLAMEGGRLALQPQQALGGGRFRFRLFRLRSKTSPCRSPATAVTISSSVGGHMTRLAPLALSLA